MKPTIGIGIIGTGGRGVTCLGLRIVETCEETSFRIVAVNDINSERMREAQAFLTAKFAEKGIEADIRCHATDQDLVDDPAVNIILVTSPQYAHCPNATVALRSARRPTWTNRLHTRSRMLSASSMGNVLQRARF